MGKGRRKAAGRKAETDRNAVLEAVVEAKEGLLELVVGAGFGVLGALLEQDRCGPSHARSKERQAYRHGHDEGDLPPNNRASLRVRI